MIIPVTHKGIHYWPSFEAARAYAVEHGHPTDRIISYQLGWAIQLRVSGPYVGPLTDEAMPWCDHCECYHHETARCIDKGPSIGCDLDTCSRALNDYLDGVALLPRPPAPGPVAVCWEEQAGCLPIRLSFAILVF